MIALLVALGAGAGAATRFVSSTLLDGGRFHTGTWIVNVLGSFLLGLLSGAQPGPEALALLGIGFCGGLTTYSSFAVQTHGRGPRAGAVYAAATLGLALLGCALGFWIGRAL